MESGEGVAQVGHSGATPVMQGMAFVSGVISATCCSRMRIELWSWTALCLNSGSSFTGTRHAGLNQQWSKVSRGILIWVTSKSFIHSANIILSVYCVPGPILGM